MELIDFFWVCPISLAGCEDRVQFPFHLGKQSRVPAAQKTAGQLRLCQGTTFLMYGVTCDWTGQMRYARAD